LVATIGGSVVVLAMALLAWPHLEPADAYLLPAGSVAAVAYATLGWLIVRRASNPIGWILLGEGTGLVLINGTSLYAVLGFAHPGSLPSPALVGAASEWIFTLVVMALAFALLLFPTGELPSRRWRWVAIAAGVMSVFGFVSIILTPRDIALPAPGGISLTYPNPVAVSALHSNVFGTLTGVGALATLMLAAAAVALVIRYRNGDLIERQQIKWVAFAATLFVLCQIALIGAFLTVGTNAAVTTVIGLVSALFAMFGLPAAVTIAILKHGLYDIDRIINRTVVYGFLAAILTVVYVAIVAGVGAFVGYGGGPVLSVAAAAAIALLFQPLRHRAQTIANRLVYGDRATPYQVLSEFAGAMARTLPLDEQLDRMVSLLASGTAADRVEVWIRVASTQQRTVVWPHAAEASVAPPLDSEITIEGPIGTFPVTHDDEHLGTIVVAKPHNEQLSPTEIRLAEHVASQAGLVVRNVRLTAELQHTIDELRASRSRLVRAQDTERRKIERNLHDGAQQQLVALGVQLGLLERFAAHVPEADTLTAGLQQLRDTLGGALDDLRDLARGIYPPLLADRGLVAALDAQARKAAVTTIVEAHGVERYDQQVEAAVYFCALEALQNVAKYADATSAVVRLAASNGRLSFEVADDGRGFEPGAARGSGLQGMADRLDAIGGRLEIESEPGRGTVVRGIIDIDAAT
ncbi:MAG TPA: histidine kinase, partial [Candidatus Dormibacteraeota bacterium]|nr:histidine kinase [Candidatus Dormibacteraeota bacterium]